MSYDEDRAKAMAISIQNFEKMNAFGGKPAIKLPEFVGCDAKFPEEVFDPSMQLFLNDFARAFQVDFGVAAALALSTAAMSCRGRFMVVREGDHKELLTFYTILRLPPSRMKTSMVEAIMKPFDIENTKLIKSVKKMDATEQKVAKKRIKLLENQAALCYNEQNFETLICEIRQLQDRIDDATRLHRWRVGSGFTPEGLARVAYEEGGTLAVVGSELGKLKKFPVNRDDVLLAGWEGAAFESNTKKDPFKISTLCLNLLLFVQIDASRKFIDVKDFVDDGLISRFLIVSPQHKVSNNNDPYVGILAEESKKIWSSKIQTIFSCNAEHSMILNLSDKDAKEYWTKVHQYCDNRSFEEGMKPGMSSWYRKAAGTALRLAGILHLLNDERSTSTDLPLEDIQNSIRVLQYYRDQTQFLLQEDKEKTLKRANRILDIFKAIDSNTICERDVYRKIGNGEPDEDYRAALKLLKEYRWIDVSGGRGNKRLCLNPRAREVWDERSSI